MKPIEPLRFGGLIFFVLFGRNAISCPDGLVRKPLRLEDTHHD